MRKIDRFLEYLKFQGISENKATVDCGLSVGLIGQAKRGKSDLGDKAVDKILSKYQDLSRVWLLTGDGEMINNVPQNFQNVPQREKKLPHTSATHVPDGKKDGIPLVPLSAMAGALTYAETVMEAECERYIVPGFMCADFLIQVRGNSMQPTYNTGDYVACKKVPLSDIFFQWGKVYAVDTNQGPLIKRVKPGKDDGHILLVSDNPDYDPIEFPLSALNGVALVLGFVRVE